MQKEINIFGGLGDIFCKLVMDDFCNHQIRNVRADTLNIYSDNIGSYELFKYSIFNNINTFPYKEVEESVASVSNKKFVAVGLSKEEENLFSSLQSKRICVFHPFTSTPYKIMPDYVDKQKFIDILIDKYKYTVVLLNQDTEVKFNSNPLVVKENIDYHREGLVRVSDYTDNISRLGFNITVWLAERIIATNSAYIMLRNTIMPQKTLGLFWEGRGEHEDGFRRDHYFIRGIDKEPNMYVYYSDIINVDSTLERFMSL